MSDLKKILRLDVTIEKYREAKRERKKESN